MSKNRVAIQSNVLVVTLWRWGAAEHWTTSVELGRVRRSISSPLAEGADKRPHRADKVRAEGKAWRGLDASSDSETAMRRDRHVTWRSLRIAMQYRLVGHCSGAALGRRRLVERADAASRTDPARHTGPSTRSKRNKPLSRPLACAAARSDRLTGLGTRQACRKRASGRGSETRFPDLEYETRFQCLEHHAKLPATQHPSASRACAWRRRPRGCPPSAAGRRPRSCPSDAPRPAVPASPPRRLVRPTSSSASPRHPPLPRPPPSSWADLTPRAPPIPRASKVRRSWIARGCGDPMGGSEPMGERWRRSYGLRRPCVLRRVRVLR